MEEGVQEYRVGSSGMGGFYLSDVVIGFKIAGGCARRTSFYSVNHSPGCRTPARSHVT